MDSLYDGLAVVLLYSQRTETFVFESLLMTLGSYPRIHHWGVVGVHWELGRAFQSILNQYVDTVDKSIGSE